MINYELAILDLDSILHIVANKQFSAGNRDNIKATKSNVHSFINQVRKQSRAKTTIGFYQIEGFDNFRNKILPEYKGHRKRSEAIECWKPTIIDAFIEAGLYGLKHVESDDACAFLARYVGYDKVVVVSADKDMVQIPCTHYNPFKAHMKNEDRWQVSSPYYGDLCLYRQVLTGDPTDMPGELCGIQRVGDKTALKMLANCKTRQEMVEVVMQAYGDAYGLRIGKERAIRTYQMVRLLNGKNDSYAPAEASKELLTIMNQYANHLVAPVDDTASLFKESSPSAADLFGLN